MNKYLRRAKKMREQLDNIISNFDDETAVTNKDLFINWSGNGVSYTTGDKVFYNDKLYKVLQNHTSQEDWNPADAPSLFAEVLIPDEDIIPDWIQPDSTNPYMTGDKVKHNNLIWQSEIDNNVWEPGVYGWTQVIN